MRFMYDPERVCSKKFLFDVDEQSHTIENFEYKGGCPGNLAGIARLIKGRTIEEIIDIFEAMPICPSSKVTSCPEQMRNALLEVRSILNGEKKEAAASPFSLGLFKN